MGIDVWVLRQERKATPTTKDVTPPPAEAPLPKAKPAARPASTPVPEFHFCFATYSDLSLVFCVPLEALALPDSLRRFADDIAIAMGGSAESSITALRWPMVRSAHIDQSIDAARAVVKQRFDKCAKRLVLFGSDVVTYFDPSDKRARIQVEAFEGYLKNPISKRDLWKSLRAFMEEAT